MLGPYLIAVHCIALAACHGRPAVLSAYGSGRAVTPNADGSPRLRDRLHDGVDLESSVGDTVLAAGPGRIVSVDYDSDSGFDVIIAHDGFPLARESMGAMFHTSYVHLRSAAVLVGERVQRGQKIGEVGIFWASGGVAHLHWRACRGMCNADTTLDPLSRTIGCFSGTHVYPADRLLLTYPLEC